LDRSSLFHKKPEQEKEKEKEKEKGKEKEEALTHTRMTIGERLLKGLGELVGYPHPVPATVRPWQEISEYIDTLDTLDIILYSCPISWYSMELQGGPWTHVGMIYRRDGVHLKHRDKLDPSDNCKVLIMESIIGREEERTSGVDLVDAKKRSAPGFHFPSLGLATRKRT